VRSPRGVLRELESTRRSVPKTVIRVQGWGGENAKGYPKEKRSGKGVNHSGGTGKAILILLLTTSKRGRDNGFRTLKTRFR